MLYEKTVEPRTLELLKELMQVAELAPFGLLGGTALSLRWGHRKSEDIDLFSNVLFNESIILEALESNFKSFIISVQEKQTLRLFIEGVKVEIISPKRPYLKPFEEVNQIRFFSLEDIMSFKMNAIERRGSKKDFYDLDEALNYFNLGELITFYQKKFETSNIAHLIKSITYFEDAESDVEPIHFKKKSWNKIKANITQNFDNYLKQVL